jgi:hypothetical protein
MVSPGDGNRTKEDVHDLTDFDHAAAKLVLVVCNRSCWEVMALSVVLDLHKRDCSVREGVSGFKVAPILALALESLYLSPHRKVGARVSRLSYPSNGEWHPSQLDRSIHAPSLKTPL